MAKLFQDLFSTDHGHGLLSLEVLIFIPIMAVWYIRFFLKKIDLPPGQK